MVSFGTSGLRGLADDLLAGPGYAHVSAFGSYLLSTGKSFAGDRILVGRDLRESSPELTRQSLAALGETGLGPVYCGVLPTPALAFHARRLGVGAVMITGSHIPPDRNGMKFYRPDGEIDKADEQAISEWARQVSTIAPAAPGELPPLPAADAGALRTFVARYRAVFAEPILKGWRVGLYQHSSVASEVLDEILTGLGAEVVRLGESGEFVAVDTEAIDIDTAEALSGWARQHRLEAIVSTDGDGDRPLLADETGRIIRGDALGLLAALFLKADAIVTPVSSNPGIDERRGAAVIRTKVGSPFVIEGMSQAVARGFECILGFEANGGLLVGSPVRVGNAELAPLPTRDSVLPILCALAAARERGVPLSELVEDLALPVSVSGRVENYARENSNRLMAGLRASPDNIRRFLGDLGRLTRLEDIDGLQLYLDDGSMIHLRPSGNAPEMRCYVSASSGERAVSLLRAGLARIERFPGAVRGEGN